MKKVGFFLLRYYQIIAIGLFFALESFAPPDRLRVFNFILRIPFLADNPQLLRLCGTLGDLFMGTLVAYLSFVAMRLLRKQVDFTPFWASLIVILGLVTFLRPFFVKADMAAAGEILKIILMIIALWTVYRLDLATAFSVWALSYLVLLAPLFIVESTSVPTGSRVLEETSVLKEIKSFNSTLQGTAEHLLARRKLQQFARALLSEAEKGDAQAQFALAMTYMEGGSVNGEPPEQSLEQSFKWMYKAASQGLVDAKVALGNFYLEGAGIPVNPAAAAKLYREAADKGNMDAAARLGWLYSHELGVDWNGEEALKRYTDAAHGGSALALWGLADMYLTGNGTPQNHELGMSYCIQAVEKGCAPAMAQLGLLMLAGADNPSTLNQSVAYIHKAAQAGVAQAQYLYMMVYTEGIGVPAWPGTVRWWGNRLSASAVSGHADSQWHWGRVLEEGLMGHADPNQAWTWISQSAYKGFPAALDAQGDYLAQGLTQKRDLAKAIVSYQTAAQYNAKAIAELILRYRNGTDVPRDPAKQDYYLRQLHLFASRGDVLAEYYLADLYRNGIVLPQNFPQALIWYRRSAENGMGQSYYRLAEMYENGEGVTKNETTAFQNYRRAANLYYLPAFYNVAVRLFDGIGTTKNPLEAKEWFLRIQRGAQRGSFAHELSFARLRERGLFVPRDEGSAAALYHTAALRQEVDIERALAKMIKEGRGVPKNLPLAFCWLDHAARGGDGRAKRLRDALMKEMPDRDRAQAKKLSLTFQPG